MRSSLRWIGPAAILAFLFLPAAGAFAESATTDNSQIDPAGAAPYVPKAGNLNSVPEDGTNLGELPGSDTPLVKQILAARPDEDLVICIAGCYTDRSRVTYAQPSAKALRGTLSSTNRPADPQKLGAGEKPSRAAAALDPLVPAIINRTN